MKPLTLLCCLLFSTPLFAQSDFSAHEWGTFTTLSGSDGKRLNGLFVDEEKLPRFVQDKANLNSYWDGTYKENDKGYPIKNYAHEQIPLQHVNVKMETPVIYFYSDHALDVSVEVDFPRGSISQWYPPRSGGEPDLSIETELNTFPIIDFQDDFNGNIQWSGRILEPTTTLDLLFKDVPHVWEAPRKPKSNKFLLGAADAQ